MARIKKTLFLIVVLSVVFLGSLIFINMSNNILKDRQTSLETNSKLDGGSSQTELAAKEMAEFLVLNNPDGPALINGEYSISSFSADDVLTKIITSKVGEASDNITNVSVDNSRLIIVKDRDQAFWDYLIESSKLVGENAKTAQSQLIDVDNPSILDFQLLADIYANSTDRLYSLAVPENLLFIHQDRLELFLLYENIYLNLVNYELDPLSASVAISLLKEVDEDMALLNDIILDIINKYKG